MASSRIARLYATRPHSTQKMPDLGKMIDVGANMLDSMFQGEFNGSQKQQPTLARAWEAGVQKIMVSDGHWQICVSAARSRRRQLTTVKEIPLEKSMLLHHFFLRRHVMAVP